MWKVEQGRKLVEMELELRKYMYENGALISCFNF